MLPTLDELYGEWQPRGAEFLGINAEGAQISREELLAFLRKRPSAYPVVLDDQEVGGIYGVFSIPHIVIVRRDGTVARVFVGQASRQQLADALADASK
jgi:hypothetical protein